MEKQKLRGEDKKPFWKKWWFWGIIVIVIIIGGMIPDEPQENTQMVEINQAETEESATAIVEPTTEPTATEEPTTKKNEQIEEPTTTAELTTESQEHIYDNAIIKDVMNGFRSEKIGEYSIVEIDSTRITEEVLTDWYFNYVTKNDFNWSMILYTDKENEGVYANAGTISKDVSFDIDEYGDYSLGDCSRCITYIPNDEDKLEEIYSAENNSKISKDISIDEFVEIIKALVQGQLGENEEIKDVKCESGDLFIYVDFSKADPSPISFEDLAFVRTGSITDSILELSEYDSLWENIIIDFGEIGYIKNGKDNIKYNEFGRFFDSINFKIE